MPFAFILVHSVISSLKFTWNRSQWPSGLRRVPTADRLLGLRVRIPTVTWMSVCCVVCQVEVSATGRSLIQRSPTDCGVSLCVIYRPHERGGPGPAQLIEN